MMQITKIEQKNTRLVRIYLNDAPAFCLPRTALEECVLKEGEGISSQRLEELCSTVLLREAKSRCLQILKSYDRTEAQLRTKLKEEEYPDGVIEEAVAYVRSYHYIDDVRFACQYVSGRQGKKSPLQLKAELMAKGVRSEDIEYALRTEYTQEQAESIRYWIRKKNFDMENADEKEKMKFTQFLIRKGFPYAEIKKTLT